MSEKSLPRFSFELLTLVYFALWFVFREITFDGIAMDEADELLFAQKLGRGYMFRNPPLFTWTLFAAERVFGASIDLPAILRFSALAAGFIALYHACRLIFDRPGLAAIAAASPITLYLIGWRMVNTYTHSPFLFAACAFTLWGVLLIQRHPVTSRYAFLGLIVGCGLLTKYNFSIFLLSVVGSACSDQDLRKLVVNRRALITAAIALVIAVPHAAWLLQNVSDIAFVAQRRFGTASSWSDLGTRLYGLYALLRSLLEFVVPFILLFAIALTRRKTNNLVPSSDYQQRKRVARLIRRSVLTQLVVIVALIFIAGAVQIRVHHLLTLVLFPIWLIAEHTDRLSVRRLSAVIAVVTLMTMVAIPLAFRSGRASARRVSEGTLRVVDYSELAEVIRNEQLDRGTIVLIEGQYAMSGSVRPYLPVARILSTKWPEFESGRRSVRTSHMFLWRKGGLDPAYGRLIEQYLVAHPAAFIRSVDIPLTRSKRTLTFQYIAVRPANSKKDAEAVRLERDLLSTTSTRRGWRNG